MHVVYLVLTGVGNGAKWSPQDLDLRRDYPHQSGIGRMGQNLPILGQDILPLYSHRHQITRLDQAAKDAPAEKMNHSAKKEMLEMAIDQSNPVGYRQSPQECLGMSVEMVVADAGVEDALLPVHHEWIGSALSGLNCS